MMSLISVEQGMKFGLVDANGDPLVTPAFEAAIGGIGGQVTIPGYIIDNLIVPTLSGYNLIFKNARLGVHDIGVFDESAGDFIILDGVFGSNFLCATMEIETLDFAGTIFEHVIIDTPNALLGFDVNDIYTIPRCGDANHPRPAGDITGDCRVNLLDTQQMALHWLSTGCTALNQFCGGSDLSRNGTVNFIDYNYIASDWHKSSLSAYCGDIENPWLTGDFNRDCSIDWLDIRIAADEWLNSCDWLNWNCRGADLNGDNFLNFTDMAGAASKLGQINPFDYTRAKSKK